MHQVWKYEVPIVDGFSLHLPKGARILDVQEQMGRPQLWALVDGTAPTEERKFRLAGTGHHIGQAPELLHHVGTFQMNSGALVFHVFEVRP